ncbi:MAG TPA: methionine--tRNA ligase [Methylomirabilota bacterium]|jgi:methionyl-tRNA synthetase
MGSFYVTTAIPYVNAAPHLGFALELVQADVLARYHRLRGDSTWFLTGTDENSLTNVLAAEREGLPVRSLVDRNAEVFRALTGTLHISNDDFIRTATEQRHRDGARRFWDACVRAGDVYKRFYRGLYCARCERFYTNEELVDGRCPEHEITPDVVEEENYFFRLSRYERRLAELLESRALRVLPESRHHEVQAFIARGLTDFSISRTRARARGWGIPVPGDPDQVIYVWFDALTNYITALGYGTDADPYRRHWIENSNRVHVIGKDILRFHAVYWPAMLLSAGAPLPTTIVVHGFLTRDGRRMSKTLGTGIDPIALAESWGADAVRYWLLREVPPVDDADYTDASFTRAYTADLANDLGNLLQRTVSMIHRYRGGVVAIPTPAAVSSLRADAERLAPALHRALGEGWDPRVALEAVLSLVASANRLVDERKPWALSRDEREGNADAGRRLDVVLWDLAECLRLAAEALRPFLPQTAEAIATQLGVGLASSWQHGLCWGGLGAGTRVLAPTPLFPKRAS